MIQVSAVMSLVIGLTSVEQYSLLLMVDFAAWTFNPSA